MDGDEGRRQLGHRPDAAGSGVGDVMQLEIEEKADTRSADRRRKGIAHAGRAVRQEELQPQLDAADGRLGPPAMVWISLLAQMRSVVSMPQ